MIEILLEDQVCAIDTPALGLGSNQVELMAITATLLLFKLVNNNPLYQYLDARDEAIGKQLSPLHF